MSGEMMDPMLETCHIAHTQLDMPASTGLYPGLLIRIGWTRIGVMYGLGRLIGWRGYPPVSVLCRYVTWNENKNRDLSLIETKLGGDPEKHQLRIKTNSA